jgi:chlorite dismutase
MDKAYMYILGYTVYGDLDEVLVSISSVDGGDLIIRRIYLSLSPGAHIIIWLASEDTEDILDYRFSLLKTVGRDCMESIVWPSVYKSSPYLREEFDVRDRLSGDALRYLIAYPMKKSPDWYLLPYDERREMMVEHIRLARGHRYADRVRSYTTYGFGLSDYEFLVLYEAESLYDWVEIVEDLRVARVRRWVVREEPLLVGEYISID